MSINTTISTPGEILIDLPDGQTVFPYNEETPPPELPFIERYIEQLGEPYLQSCLVRGDISKPPQLLLVEPSDNINNFPILVQIGTFISSKNYPGDTKPDALWKVNGHWFLGVGKLIGISRLVSNLQFYYFLPKEGLESYYIVDSYSDLAKIFIPPPIAYQGVKELFRQIISVEFIRIFGRPPYTRSELDKVAAQRVQTLCAALIR